MEGRGEVRTECVVSGFNIGVHRTESSSFVHITESHRHKRCKAYAHYRAKDASSKPTFVDRIDDLCDKRSVRFTRKKRSLARMQNADLRSYIVHTLERMVIAQLHGDRRGVQSRNESELNLFRNCISTSCQTFERFIRFNRFRNRVDRFKIDSRDSK
jgi:hypothetical protein